jgi:hypothetical protein
LLSLFGVAREAVLIPKCLVFTGIVSILKKLIIEINPES